MGKGIGVFGKMSGNRGQKTSRFDLWAYQSGIGDKPKAIDSLIGAGM